MSCLYFWLSRWKYFDFSLALIRKYSFISGCSLLILFRYSSVRLEIVRGSILTALLMGVSSLKFCMDLDLLLGRDPRCGDARRGHPRRFRRGWAVWRLWGVLVWFCMSSFAVALTGFNYSDAAPPLEKRIKTPGQLTPQFENSAEGDYGSSAQKKKRFLFRLLLFPLYFNFSFTGQLSPHHSPSLLFSYTKAPFTLSPPLSSVPAPFYSHNSLLGLFLGG